MILFIGMCINPITLKNGQRVPCGKCAECNKQYQNSWALRMAEESEDWLHTHFFTLTYDEEHCPKVDVYPYYCDYYNEDGGISGMWFNSPEEYEYACSESRYIFSGPLYCVKDEISEYLNKLPVNIYNTINYYEKPYLQYLNPDWQDGEVRSVPSQRPHDLVKLINSLRKYLERKDKGKIKYFACSEYGETTLRCHYHLLVFTNEPWEVVFPAVKRYWKCGYVDENSHEITQTYNGKYADTTAAYLYVSKYVSKPEFMVNPYEKCGYVSSCSRYMSKGIGRTYRQDLRKKFDRKFADKFAPAERLRNVLYDMETGKSYNQIRTENSMKLEDVRSDLVDYYDANVTKINSLNISLLDEFFQSLNYLCKSKDKYLTYNCPRYWKDSIKPTYKVKEKLFVYDKEEISEIEKTLTRVDSLCVWYKAYQAYVQLRNIRRAFNELQAGGKIDDSTPRKDVIRAIREKLSYVDEDRYRKAMVSAYKPYTKACGRLR